MPYTNDMAKKQRIAIFDIDGTVFRSSLIIELFNELVRRGIFPRHASAKVERKYLLWLNRKGHYNDYLMQLVDVFYKNIAGCSVAKIEPAVRTVIAWQKDRVHRFPRQLLTDLRKQGYFILVISNSPEPMVRRFARALKFDAAIGHTLEVKNGIYTGRSIDNGVPMPGHAWMDKIAILRRFLSDRNMSIDRRNSVMIGDSEGDVPLLSHVGKPIAFNPSLPLARLAKERGWRIVIERKDAVYDVRDAQLVAVSGQTPRVPYGHVKR